MKEGKKFTPCARGQGFPPKCILNAFPWAVTFLKFPTHIFWQEPSQWCHSSTSHQVKLAIRRQCLTAPIIDHSQANPHVIMALDNEYVTRVTVVLMENIRTQNQRLSLLYKHHKETVWRGGMIRILILRQRRRLEPNEYLWLWRNLMLALYCLGHIKSCYSTWLLWRYRGPWQTTRGLFKLIFPTENSTSKTFARQLYGSGNKTKGCRNQVEVSIFTAKEVE